MSFSTTIRNHARFTIASGVLLSIAVLAGVWLGMARGEPQDPFDGGPLPTPADAVGEFDRHVRSEFSVVAGLLQRIEAYPCDDPCFEVLSPPELWEGAHDRCSKVEPAGLKGVPAYESSTRKETLEAFIDICDAVEMSDVHALPDDDAEWRHLAAQILEPARAQGLLELEAEK